MGLIFDEFYTARRAEFEFDVFQHCFDNHGFVLQCVPHSFSHFLEIFPGGFKPGGGLLYFFIC